MLGVRFVKAQPTTYLLQDKAGRVKREGAGLSFFYYAPTTTLVSVPLASADVPFVFNEVTADFQSITVQGQLSYRVRDPKQLASLLDFSIEPDGSYRADDPELLEQRLVGAAQVATRGATSALTLRQALASSEATSTRVLDALHLSESVTLLGVEVLSFTILSIKATPEMAKALEAAAREELQRSSDEAIYARRNAAVQQERTIKESELATEIAVELKKREIRETQMAAEIAVEEQRTALIETRVANERKDADSRAYALEATLKPVRDVDWRTLMAVIPGADPRLMIAVAFRELASNAQKIGELNIMPDLLGALLSEKRGK